MCDKVVSNLRLIKGHNQGCFIRIPIWPQLDPTLEKWPGYKSDLIKWALDIFIYCKSQYNLYIVYLWSINIERTILEGISMIQSFSRYDCGSSTYSAYFLGGAGGCQGDIEGALGTLVPASDQLPKRLY